MLKNVLKAGVRSANVFLKPFGGKISRIAPYDQDGLAAFHNTEFMQDPAFQAAYQRAVKAGKEDYRIHWRVHVALWAASQAIRLEGDFVECGVCRGFLSSAIMHYLDWNQYDRHFFLFDTFCGLDESLVSKEEIALGRIEENQRFYVECYEEVKENFKEYRNVKIIRGSVPSTLSTVNISSVVYLSIDMNCIAPEIAALEFFWPKIVRGGLVLLDDYGFIGYEPQKRAMDSLANCLGVKILSLPTGQGLIIK